MKKRSHALKKVLANSRGERDICTFIKRNPDVLMKSINFLGTPSMVFAEFPLGNEHRADFLVLARYSGAIEIFLIEFEPPTDKLFNKDGTLAGRANRAITQVHNWKVYVEHNRTQFIRDLRVKHKTNDLWRGPRPGEELTCSAGLDISHPNMDLSVKYGIFIGRRSEMRPEDRQRRNQIFGTAGIFCATFDRLCDAAEALASWSSRSYQEAYILERVQAA